MSNHEKSRSEVFSSPFTPGVTVEVVLHNRQSGDFGGFWVDIEGHGPVYVGLSPDNIARLREQLAPFPQETYFPLV